MSRQFRPAGSSLLGCGMFQRNEACRSSRAASTKMIHELDPDQLHGRRQLDLTRSTSRRSAAEERIGSDGAGASGSHPPRLEIADEVLAWVP
jgi:hypothetical protein